MAYTLQAIAAPVQDLSNVAVDGLRIVPLDQGIAIWPLTDTVLDQYRIPFLPLTDDDPAEIPLSIIELGGHFQKCAYLEAEFFGGNGIQAAVLFSGGTFHKEIRAQTAINEALRFLGINRTGELDEFDTVRLGQHRHTGYW